MCISITDQTTDVQLIFLVINLLFESLVFTKVLCKVKFISFSRNYRLSLTEFMDSYDNKRFGTTQCWGVLSFRLPNSRNHTRVLNQTDRI